MKHHAASEHNSILHQLDQQDQPQRDIRYKKRSFGRLHQRLVSLLFEW